MTSFSRNFVIILCLASPLLFLRTCFSQTSTILQGQQLKHGDQLVSNSGVFKFGFKTVFQNNTYLGIWYYGEDDNLLWVANRNTPVLGNSGILQIGNQGSFEILHKEGEPIVLYSVDEQSNTSVTLEDTGNLVLNELNPDGSIKQVLWQSFDHPTDTLLPGMKLGVNQKTGISWTLSSWRSDKSPATGSFSLGMDPRDTNQIVIWWGSNMYWRSNMFSSHDSYKFSYISDENGTYFNYSVSKAVTIFPRLRLDYVGQLISSMADSLVTEVSCSNYTGGGGCVKQDLPNCRDRDHITIIPHLGFMSSSGFKFSDSNNLSSSDCQAKCLKDCSCVGYAPENDDGTGCEIWRTGVSFTESTTLNNRGDTRRNIFILEPRDNKWWLWMLIVVGLVFILPPLSSLCYIVWKKFISKGDESTKMHMLLSELGDNSTPYIERNFREHEGNEVHIFSFESIVNATNCFSTVNKLGEGGYGPVYKGRLADGREIAIKRLSKSSTQGLVEFKNEAKLIAKLQHMNLVRLLGFCIQGEEKILIYEYMPNKSLDFFLFDISKKNLLNWKKRLAIIEGIAQGLIYLHKYSRLRVIHRDLKASNILLDEELNPKIADFGLARIFSMNESEAKTKRVVGTYGYMSPEYASHGLVSVKTDVFSFGVLLLEIVSGKKNNFSYDAGNSLNLIGYVWLLWKEGRGLEILDPSMDDLCCDNEVMRCIHVGLLCVQDHAVDRPTMMDVVSMLSNESFVLEEPKQPAFLLSRVEDSIESSFKKKTDNFSVNYASLTVMDAR